MNRLEGGPDRAHGLEGVDLPAQRQVDLAQVKMEWFLPIILFPRPVLVPELGDSDTAFLCRLSGPFPKGEQHLCRFTIVHLELLGDHPFQDINEPSGSHSRSGSQSDPFDHRRKIDER
ncbi:hypothetical protein BOG92_048410 [Streptomyces sp. WAC00263]|nr:hypothetical protein BOG92_048410 [Streptomyces sp. WAC00263]